MSLPYFKKSPFLLTASKDNADFWAGRPAIKTRIDRLVRAWSSREDSTLDVVWANFGCGKTHLLRHIEWLATQSAPASKIVPIYIEVPENRVGFLEWYRRILEAIPREVVVTAVIARAAVTEVESLKRLALAFRNGGTTEREMGRNWINGGNTPLRELRQLTGIDERIDSDARAIAILCEIVAGFATAGGRCVLLLDEYQRVGSLSENARVTLLSGLRTLFSANPTGLSSVLAVTSRLENTAYALIPDELKTLVGMRPAFQLPEFDASEAKAFLLERFRYFRPAGYSGALLAPFEEDEIDQIFGAVASDPEAHLIPRTILQSVSGLYDLALDRMPGQKISIAEMRETLGLKG